MIWRRCNALVATAVVAGACAIAAGSAPAYVSLTPNLHDFGAQQVGTASAPVIFTLRVRCIEDPAMPGSGVCDSGPEPFTPNVSVTGDFRIEENNCTSMMPGSTTFGTTCTFAVRFAPVLAGVREGIVSSGDPDGFGRSGVKGLGTAVSSTGQPGKSKKCKRKKRSAAAAKKKCKKKRK